MGNETRKKGKKTHKVSFKQEENGRGEGEVAKTEPEAGELWEIQKSVYEK